MAQSEYLQCTGECIAAQAPCACCIGDACCCSKLAVRSISTAASSVLVICDCDCGGCSCNDLQSIRQAQASLTGGTWHPAHASVASQGLSQQHLLPCSAMVLTLEAQQPSRWTNTWQQAAQQLLQDQAHGVAAVRLSRQQGQLQVLYTCHGRHYQDSAGVQSQLQDFGLRLRAQKLITTYDWSMLLAKVQSKHVSTVVHCRPELSEAVAATADAPTGDVSAAAVLGTDNTVACELPADSAASTSCLSNSFSNNDSGASSCEASAACAEIAAVPAASEGAPTADGAAAAADSNSPATARILVGGMTCAMCTAAVEDVIKQIPGIMAVTVNLAVNTATITYDPITTGPRSVIEAVQDAGFEAQLLPDDGQGNQAVAATAAAKEAATWRTRLIVALVLATPVAVLSMLAMAPGLQESLEGPHNLQIADAARQQQGLVSQGTMGVMQHSDVQHANSSIGSSTNAGHAVSDARKVVGGLPITWLVQLVLATGVQFYVGRVFYSSAYYSLKHKRPNMAVLVVLGTTAAYVYSIIAMVLAAVQTEFSSHVYFESCALIITFVCLGKYIEARARATTGDAVNALLGLTPCTALLVLLDHNGSSSNSGNSTTAVVPVVLDSESSTDVSRKHGISQQVRQPACTEQQLKHCQLSDDVLALGYGTKEVPLELVQVNDILKVLPGATIPTDGTVMQGTSSVNESLITGEGLPVIKTPGYALIGGSVNGPGLLLMRVSRVGQSTVLAGIAKLVQESQANKAAIQVCNCGRHIQVALCAVCGLHISCHYCVTHSLAGCLALKS
eukprot:GHRR01003986.1.p1 GENE.GHRR01003986.1~~GHRR01003986.1.p1  ORF type:complete len:789 (+),score=295.50 GHRR01003986.1:658-3024(+)